MARDRLEQLGNMRTKNGARLGVPICGVGGSAQGTPGESTLRMLLFELATVLLQRGVTPPQFNNLAKKAFIDAAAKMSRFRSGKVNQSRVAVLTGLRRAEVRKLLSRANSPKRSDIQRRSPVDTVVAAWCADRRFGDRGGHPKRLAIAGTKTSFAVLVKQYAGDVPHRAVLNELSRLGVVRQIGKNVEVRSLSALRQRQNFVSFAYSMPAIVDGIRSASNPRKGVGVNSVRRLVLPAHNLFDLETIRERCNSGIESMLGGLSASLSPRDMKSRRAKQAHSCAVSVIFAENRGPKLNGSEPS